MTVIPAPPVGATGWRSQITTEAVSPAARSHDLGRVRTPEERGKMLRIVEDPLGLREAWERTRKAIKGLALDRKQRLGGLDGIVGRRTQPGEAALERIRDKLLTMREDLDRGLGVKSGELDQEIGQEQQVHTTHPTCPVELHGVKEDRIIDVTVCDTVKEEDIPYDSSTFAHDENVHRQEKRVIEQQFIPMYSMPSSKNVERDHFLNQIRRNLKLVQQERQDQWEEEQISQTQTGDPPDIVMGGSEAHDGKVCTVLREKHQEAVGACPHVMQTKQVEKRPFGILYLGSDKIATTGSEKVGDDLQCPPDFGLIPQFHAAKSAVVATPANPTIGQAAVDLNLNREGHNKAQIAATVFATVFTGVMGTDPTIGEEGRASRVEISHHRSILDGLNPTAEVGSEGAAITTDQKAEGKLIDTSVMAAKETVSNTQVKTIAAVNAIRLDSDQSVLMDRVLVSKRVAELVATKPAVVGSEVAGKGADIDKPKPKPPFEAGPAMADAGDGGHLEFPPVIQRTAGNTIDPASVLGKRGTSIVPGTENSGGIDGGEPTDQDKKKKGTEDREENENSDEEGGTEATDPRALGQLAGANESARQEP